MTLLKKLSIKKKQSSTSSTTMNLTNSVPDETTSSGSHSKASNPRPTKTANEIGAIHTHTAKFQEGKVDKSEPVLKGTATKISSPTVTEVDNGNETDETPAQLLPDIEKNPLDEIAVTSSLLGVLFGLGFTNLFFTNFKAFAIYLMALSLFHFLEFYTTAKYNPTKVHKESFIINNGSAYPLAHTIAVVEFFAESKLFPNFKVSHSWINTLGLLLIVGGQIVRSIAMITAGHSFSHLVVTKKENNHELITHGIYAYFRHPSYAGFFWWALGTQLVLLNPISLVLFIFVLWKFFDTRIRFEERFLISFFGDRYEKYRTATPVRIPFIE